MRCRVLFGFVSLFAALDAFAQVEAHGPPGPRRSAIAEKRALRPAFGVAGASYVRQSFAEFFPIDPVNNTYHDLLGSNFGRYGTGVGYLIGPHPNIPGGALLSYLELDGCDFNDPGYVRLELFACDYLGACGSDPLVDLITTTTGSPGCGNVAADLSPLGYVVDNFLGELVPLVTTSTGSGTTLLSGVIYGYTLQVRPPPPMATFNDVPINHPFFQYVEALAASGITAGCQAAPPLYCPDQALTRGQMAVFLSKALGLYWPQ